MAIDLKSIFDKVYVISLPTSIDRRAYIKTHLDSLAVEEYVFHNAVHSSDPEVKEHFENGLVRQYPPCFRCGMNECGRKDCNNTLIPQQVATFLSYKSLWNKIASEPQRALVMEDDVIFHKHADIVLKFLREEITEKRIRFVAEFPTLLRLGWALCSDHSDAQPPRNSTDIKMSNPCHALTSAMAKRALENARTINHTVDVYLHRDLPRPGEAVTIYPPIASELSWSTGEFDSLIHPKKVRAEFLSSQGRHHEASQASMIAEIHARTVAHKTPPESSTIRFKERIPPDE
jgi:GR25 family glycosyltransferase involved in LPS biosynthesis